MFSKVRLTSTYKLKFGCEPALTACGAIGAHKKQHGAFSILLNLAMAALSSMLLPNSCLPICISIYSYNVALSCVGNFIQAQAIRGSVQELLTVVSRCWTEHGLCMFMNDSIHTIPSPRAYFVHPTAFSEGPGNHPSEDTPLSDCYRQLLNLAPRSHISEYG